MNFYQVKDIDGFDVYYKLKCQDDAVLWSGFPSAPDKTKLYNHFLHNIIEKDKVLIFYLEDNDKIIGYVQGTVEDETTVEFSATNIFKEYQGQGYLQDMTTLFIDEMKKKGYKTIIGWASEKNKPAEFNMICNKFQKLDIYDERNLPLLGGIHKFFKWIKEL